MPAKSKKQQKLFGVARAIQKGEMDPDEAGGAAKDIAKNVSKKDVKDFASTRHRGLPEKKKEKEAGWDAVHGFWDAYTMRFRRQLGELSG